MGLPRLIWRGLRDTFDQLLMFGVYSVCWWLCIITIIPGPSATVALFAMCDPRRRVSQPEFSEAVAIARSSFRRAWGIAVCTVPLIIILLWNLAFFTDTDHPLLALAPLWIIMLVILCLLLVYAFAIAAAMESRARNAYRGAMYVLVSRPFRSLALFIFLALLGLSFAIMVLPLLLIGPALMAAIINRFVLAALDVPVIDPDAPTEERQYERERGINPEKGFVSRLRGNGNDKKRNRQK